MKRFFIAAPAAALLAASLVSCQSAAPELAASECVQPGSVSESIAVTGDLGQEVTLTSATPVNAVNLERSVLIEGDGDDLELGEQYRVYITMINGANGEVIASFPDSMELEGSYHEAVRDSLNCSSVGDRIALTMTASDLYGAGTVENMGIQGLSEDDSIVIVIDFTEKNVILDKAEGEEQELPEGAPKVTVSSTGEPTIEFPEGVTPPEKLTVHTLVAGEGATVTDANSVVVHYRGVIWRTGEEFDSSWSRGEPATFAVNGVIDGFKEALAGQKVGSRMLTIVPANDGGYGSDWLIDRGYEEDDVMVFVLDILGVI